VVIGEGKERGQIAGEFSLILLRDARNSIELVAEKEGRLAQGKGEEKKIITYITCSIGQAGKATRGISLTHQDVRARKESRSSMEEKGGWHCRGGRTARASPLWEKKRKKCVRGKEGAPPLITFGV